MDEQATIPTCLICKHALVSKLNIFKTRTSFSKTLVSSKLSKLVQATFKQEAMPDSQDICFGCSALINQVDECEIKLMALENEVKLKYKMPFPIEVHSRKSDSHVLQPLPAPPHVGSTEEVVAVAASPAAAAEVEGPLAGGESVAGEGGVQESREQEFSFISIDGSALDVDNPTIVLEAGEVDMEGNNVVVYREPYGSQTLTYDPSMSYLAQLEQAELDQESVPETDHSSMVLAPGQKKIRLAPASREGETGALLCNLCDETFNSMDSLRNHKICHESDRSFPCRFCHRVYPTNIALHHHWNEEHPLDLQPCPYCDKRFYNKSNLNQHINTHKEPRFNCEQPDCGRQFHTRGDLRKHMTFKHSNEKNFQCPECELSFKANWLLTRHKVRVHSQA